jgi:endonuclease-3
MSSSLLSPQEIETFFDRLAEVLPEPRSELNYVDPFTLLIAVVLSAQSTDVGVNRATATLFAEADTPETMLALGEAGVKRHIKTLGLYNSKAANVIKLCRILVDTHGGRVPRERAALEKLPGVGRKTANVILNTAFDEPTIAVDTHIYRLCNRTGLAPGKTVRAVEDALQQVVPEHRKKNAHHWLILHGRYTCKARKPACPTCAVRDICRFDAKTTAAANAGKGKHRG